MSPAAPNSAGRVGAPGGDFDAIVVGAGPAGTAAALGFSFWNAASIRAPRTCSAA